MKARNELITDVSISLKRTKIFSCPEFKDVYSNTYFRTIIKPTFENTENIYSFIFGDFNKLGVINDVYGHDFGDDALHIAMIIIKNSVPDDSVIVRAGGDEIYIILPNHDKNFADKCSKLIQNNLQKNAVLIGGLSIELASSDSTHGNIDDLLSITDNEVTNIKASREETNSPADILADDFLPLQTPESISSKEKESWSELNNLVNISVYEFLQNFRPSKNFEFKPQQIVDSSDFVTNAFVSLIDEKMDNNLPKNFTSFLKDEYPYMPIYDTPDAISKDNTDVSKNNSIEARNLNNLDDYSDEELQNIVDTLNNGFYQLVRNSPELLNHPYLQFFLSDDNKINMNNLIHSIISGDKLIDNFDKYSDLDLQSLITTLNATLEQLVRDNTGLLNKQYFRLFLAEKIINSDTEYSASYISVPGLKLSNFAYDHTFSDNRLNKTNDILCQEAKNGLNFNDSAFDSSDNNVFFLSQGGGNYLCLYPREMSNVIKPKINSIVDKVNASVNIKDPNSGFQLSSYSLHDNQTIPKTSTTDAIKYIRALKEEANFQKVPLKKQLFKSADAYFAFKKAMDNCVNYYLENIPNAEKSTTKMVQFIRNVYTSFLNQEVLHNETREDKKTVGLSDSDIEK